MADNKKVCFFELMMNFDELCSLSMTFLSSYVYDLFCLHLLRAIIRGNRWSLNSDYLLKNGLNNSKVRNTWTWEI